ncbi:MAG: class A beta-lactamase-related serine hydrolase [Candidatus Omnitrophica bacterium]|nr:class A beta-lactamase-related serine hydrolase [Candidatus Omnitrophota bacterium]
MRTRILLLLTFLCFLSAGLFFSSKIYKGYQAKKILEKRKKTWLVLEKKIKNKALRFPGRVSIVIKDLDTGWDITYNEENILPSASLVKIPIMLSFFYAAREGRVNLKDRIILKGRDRVPGSKVLGDKPNGSRFTVEELLEPMITQSDNTATNLLIDYLGFDNLNAYFKKMGLKNTNLARKMMDFKERRRGEENYTTAQDMAFLLEKLYHKDFLSQEISERCLVLLGEQKINDRIPKKLPREGAFIAHKTGLERRICHDVGIVYTRKGDFLICILVKHRDKSAASAKKFIADIALLTYNHYQYR